MIDSIRVLHVDDDPEFGAITAELLEREDDRLSVETTTSPAEALGRLDEEPVDCVVSDYDMPNMDGLDFLDAVREQDTELPFILFTGKGSEEVASDAIAAGATGYLQKRRGTEGYELLANRVRNAVEQHRSKRHLRRQNRQYKRLFEEAPVMFVVYRDEDDEPVVEDCNERFASKLGYDPEEIEGLSVREFFTPESARAAIEDGGFERAKAGEFTTDERTLQTANDDTLDVLVRGAPRYDASGDVTGVLALYIDVTEQRRRERHLQRERDRASALFENMAEPVAYYEFESDEPIVRELNPSFEEVFGATESEAVGEPLDDIMVPPDRRSEGERINERVRAGEIVDEEVVRQAADSVRTFNLLSVPLHPGESGKRGFAIYTDISERKHRRNVIEALHSVATTIQSEETVEAVCERTVTAAATILDFTLCSILIREGEWLVPYAVSENAPPDAARPMRTDQGLAGKTYQTGESQIVEEVTPDDETDPARDSYRSALSVSIGEHGVFQAVSTEPGAFDEDDGELAELLVSHTATAIDHVEHERELQRQNERLSEFASVVSHDLRNPLSLASGHLELAREDCESPHLAEIDRLHRRMERLIDELLTLAREGGTVVELEPVALDDVVYRCWDSVGTAAGELRVEAEATVRANPDRIRRLFENLMRNAVEHGGEDVTVRVGLLEDRCGFYVADDGPGIPPEDRETIFEYGYSSADDGTGFGLAIVSRIASLHGWDVTVTDSGDGGARFEVTSVEFDEQW